MVKASEPTYAVQMVRPFWALLRNYPQIPADIIDRMAATPEDARIPVAGGQRFLAWVVEQTGDENIGLLAARTIKPGSFDLLEYASLSAPNWRAAIETGFRYTRLMNEAADFRIEIEDDKAHLILRSTVPLTRAGIDFQSGAFHVAGSRWIEPTPPELEAWFTYPEPRDVSVHRLTFPNTRLRFGAPWNGFVFDARRLQTKLESADPSLHRVLRDHADRLLAKLGPAESLVEQVRAQILSSLKEGPIAAEDVAERMSITRRTLTRRLRQHDTTFSELLDQVRKHAALEYVSNTDHTVEDIAFLVGFSEASAFVRAFKRWQGMAPMQYRRALRAGEVR